MREHWADHSERAAALGDRLIVGVSTDALNFSRKQRYPVYSQDERMRIVRALKCVDDALFEELLEAKAEYLRTHRADVLVMGHGLAGRFDDLRAICEVVYLPRTSSMSTTAVIEKIRGEVIAARLLRCMHSMTNMQSLTNGEAPWLR